MTPAKTTTAMSAESFAEWVREHGAAVRGYLFAMIREAATADDLTQEVFLRAWQGREAYREQGRVRAYLFRIADRLACDHGRRRHREVTVSDEQWKELQPAAGQGEPFGQSAQAEALARLDDALAELTPVQQRVLFLRYYGQLSFNEIAETLGCPLNTALSHCRRALESLRTHLAEFMS